MKLNNFEKRAFAVGLALSMVVSGSGVNAGTAMAAKKPKLSKSKLTITAGKTAALKVKNAKKKVKWSVNKKKIVKITSKSGKKKEAVVLKGLKKGKAVVTAKVGKKKIKCKITVKAQKPNFKSVSVDQFDSQCLVLNLKKKDSSLKVSDLTVTRKESTGAFNQAVNVTKVIPVNAKKYRVYLQNGIDNGTYVQIASGISKASTQYKLPFKAVDKETNLLLKKGDIVKDTFTEYSYRVGKKVSTWFDGEIGEVKASVSKGKLPAGVILDKKSYKLKGIPTEVGTTQVTFKASDELGRTASVKVNICVYDDTAIAIGNSSEEIYWTSDLKEKAAAQVAGNATKLDADKLDNLSGSYAKTYDITPKGGSGNYTFTLDTPDNTDVRLSTDKIADDASKTVTKKSASSTKLCIPYSITAGTHTYKVTAADVMDANRTCTTTITVKVVPCYNVNGVVKSSNGLPITGTHVGFYSKDGEKQFYAYVSPKYNNAENDDASQEVGAYDIELPAGTYVVKVDGDVNYEMAKTVKITKASKMVKVTVPQYFYTVSGKATYSNSGNKLENKDVYFECLNNQYETKNGDFATTTNGEGCFNIALPANSYAAYVLDEKGNRKYFTKKITVTNKDVSVGTIKAGLARYSVEGIAFNGTAVDQQTQFADKITNTTMYFYNDKGLCVAQPSTGENGYYKVFLPGEATYTVKAYFAGAIRTLGTVTVAKANQKDVNLTYAVATDTTGATAYAANPLALESVLNSAGGNDVIWSFTPVETAEYTLKASTAVDNGYEMTLFDANMQYLSSAKSSGSSDSDDDDDSDYIRNYISSVTLEANKTYYIKVQPTGVTGRNPYTPQAQGEVKLVITKQTVVTPSEAPTPSVSPDVPAPSVSPAAPTPSASVIE